MRFVLQTSRLLRRKLGGNGDDNGGAEPLANEQPLRAELFSVSQLEEHAKSMAAWHDVAARGARPARGPDRLLPRLDANERVLREAYRLVTNALKQGRRITPA